MLSFAKKYQCIVRVGHVGAGKFIEKRVIITAENTIEAMDKATNMGGVKKGRGKFKGFVSIKEVNYGNQAAD